MHAVEKRANRNLNVCEIGFRSRRELERLPGLWGDAFRQRQIAVLVRHDNSSMSIGWVNAAPSGRIDPWAGHISLSGVTRLGEGELH